MTETPYHRPGTFSKTQEAVVDIAMIIVIISAWPFLFGFFIPHNTAKIVWLSIAGSVFGLSLLIVVGLLLWADFMRWESEHRKFYKGFRITLRR